MMFMRQSVLFASTLRHSLSDAEAVSHQLMLKAGFIRQLAAGIYSYLPLGKRVLGKIERIVREEMDQAGAQEILMPALQPAELWKESGRYSVYGDELIRLNDRHNREFALGPTHEEVITTLVKNELRSYRRFPVTLYQIQTKFRDERRPRFGLLRAREFLMKDAYSFDTTWEGLDKSYTNMYEAYKRIFHRCGLHCKVVEADAGAIGGEGGTHEFIAPAEIGEDTIVVCEQCNYTANLEKVRSEMGKTTSLDTGAATGELEDALSCPRCGRNELQWLKGIEVGHVFKLGTKYSEALGARFLDADSKEHPVIMGCYGIGVSRVLSAIVEQRHDERGIQWPQEVAPFSVHIVPVSTKDEIQMGVAEELDRQFRQQGIEVLMDDREERLGVKLNDSDLIGIPIRIVVGKQADVGKVEYTERKGNETRVLDKNEAILKIHDLVV
jgi:prolyl-tRNA synthetase